MARNRVRLGEIRPSQLMHTFGVGAIVDLPNISALVLGLDDWEQPDARREVAEERLLGLVRNHLGDQVQKLCLPPTMADEGGTPPSPLDPSALAGAPIAPFPQWVRCPRCDLIAPLDFGVFQLKTDPFRPDRGRYVHSNCPRQGKPPAVVPARFVVACQNGHLDDFPWLYYVHGGQKVCDSPLLRLYEFGVSAEAADIVVKCQTCNAKMTLAPAFGEDGAQYLPPCRGYHPHMRATAREGCKEPLRAMLAGASNLWFSITISALSIPPSDARLRQLVGENWPILNIATSREILAAFRQAGNLRPFAAWSDEEIWAAIEKKRAAPVESGPKKVAELKVAEWAAFSSPNPTNNSDDFRLREEPPPPGYERYVEKVVLAERLRVVKALTGFTRISSPGDFGDPGDIPEARRVSLCRRPPTWVPACEVRGEGIFLLLREDAIAAWLKSPKMAARAGAFAAAHAAFRRIRAIPNPEAGFPGLRYVLLHSLSHALIRQLAIECGYSAASLQERIYALDPEEEGGPTAGILLYTAAADSEGTLGGLVGLGEPRTLARHLDQALEQMRLCASDPLCAEHEPMREPITPHGAACHACLFVSETSCERGNKYLDRTLLVETIGGDPQPFFQEGPGRVGSR